MNENKRNVARIFNQKGQSMIIIAFSILGLIAFTGLAVDVGRLFIAYGNLRKAADAGALAAAGQFREGRTIAEMESAAKDVMSLNGVAPISLQVEVCDYTADPADQDPQLCTEPKRKLVRIEATASTDMTFLQAVGLHEISLSTTAVSEAASMDVVLVIDISDSMTWDESPDCSDPNVEIKPDGCDPSYCNDTSRYPGTEDSTDWFDGLIENGDGLPGECHPFEEVKAAAYEFVTRILDKSALEEEDRIQIVTFGNGWHPDPNQGTDFRLGTWTNDRDQALNTIRNLKVYQPENCHDPKGSDILNPALTAGACLKYNADLNYTGLYCYSCLETDPYDFSTLTTTNIGGGLYRAGAQFGLGTIREDSLWVVIVLTDGLANSTDIPEGSFDDPGDVDTYPIGYCPNNWTEPLCQDEDVFTRHNLGDPMYDADDYARDGADFVGCFGDDPADACNGQEGQGAVIFSIGLGEGVKDTINEVQGEPYGIRLLRYIAAVGYDGDPATDPCEDYYDSESEWEEWCGNYYFSPSGAELTNVFEDIASRIFTRLTR